MATGADGMPAVCEETPFWCHHAQSYEKSIYSVAASNPPHAAAAFSRRRQQLPDALSTLFLHVEPNVHTLAHKGKKNSEKQTLFHISLVLFIFYIFCVSNWISISLRGINNNARRLSALFSQLCFVSHQIKSGSKYINAAPTRGCCCCCSCHSICFVRSYNVFPLWWGIFPHDHWTSLVRCGNDCAQKSWSLISSTFIATTFYWLTLYVWTKIKLFL